MKNNLHILHSLATVLAHGSIFYWSSFNEDASRLGESRQDASQPEPDQCLVNVDNQSSECKADMLLPDLDDYYPQDYLKEKSSNEEPELDPMLEKMPTVDFMAYKRQDISSMYREPPGSRVEVEPSFQGIAAKFVNMSPERLNFAFDTGEGPPGDILAHPGPFESSGSATYPDLLFYFYRPSTNEIVCSFRTRKGTSIYYCDPFVQNNQSDPSAGVLWGPVRSLDNLTKDERALYDAAKYNREFASLYEDFTGSPWYGNMPQEPPRHYMHRADYFGQTHTIETVETKFTSLPPEEPLYRKLSITEMMRNDTSSIPFQEYREQGPTNITLLAASVAPRIFLIDDFLSPVECDHIIELAKRKGMYRSTTGKGIDMQVSGDRSSQTTWMPRFYSPIMDAVIKRAADVLKIDEALMRHRLPGERPGYPNRMPLCENLQVLHYTKGKEFAVHTDHGYHDARPNCPSRSINIVMYLNEGMKGGETAFPRWRNAETDGPVSGVPKKGRAAIFYMMTPDGNMDDLSVHSANPIIEGEKWFANLWTWDPIRDHDIK